MKGLGAIAGLSVEQAIDIWCDLEDALAGRHGYGGHDAEIYMYRIQSGAEHMATRVSGWYVPNTELSEWVQDAGRRAMGKLRAVCEVFSERRNCEVFPIQARERCDWPELEFHRIAVRVVPRSS